MKLKSIRHLELVADRTMCSRYSLYVLTEQCVLVILSMYTRKLNYSEEKSINFHM